MEGFNEFLERCERIGNNRACVCACFFYKRKKLNCSFSDISLCFSDGFLAGVMGKSM